MPSLPPLNLSKPGLFITGTDTDVGKTVVSCAIARAWVKQIKRGTPETNPVSGGGGLGVFKPMASGCDWKEDEWVNADAVALKRASGCLNPFGEINPVRFEKPLAPAVAAEGEGRAMDWQAVADGLMRLDQSNEAVLVEGVGGLLVPLDPSDPFVTCLDLIRWMNYPVVIVARSVLGTLNHTAMTATLLKQAGCTVAGIVMNGFDAGLAEQDPSIQTNRQWIERMTGCKVLTVMPKLEDVDTYQANGVDWAALVRG